jgi:flagellar biosynthesis GTPase FlhF
MMGTAKKEPLDQMPVVVDDSAQQGSVVTVEAPTVEAALEAISAQRGDDARIFDAQRVERGGLDGFFTKELFQVTAQLHSRPPAAVDRVLDDVSGPEDFAGVLRRELAARKLRLPSPNERDSPMEEALLAGEVHPDLREVRLDSVTTDSAPEVDLREYAAPQETPTAAPQQFEPAPWFTPSV